MMTKKVKLAMTDDEIRVMVYALNELLQKSCNNSHHRARNSFCSTSAKEFVFVEDKVS